MTYGKLHPRVNGLNIAGCHILYGSGIQKKTFCQSKIQALTF